MNIGFMYGLDISSPTSGGNVHGHFLARELIARGHRLFSWYVANGDTSFCTHFRGRQVLSFLQTIDVLYIRVEWNLAGAKRGRFLKTLRPRLPVIWELNGHPSEILFSERTEADLEFITRGLRRASSGVNAAICVADEVSDYARKSLEIQNVRCVPNGSAPEIFVPRAWADHRNNHPLHAAWIGTSRAGWHNLDAIIEAAHILKKNDANVIFSIYGDPSHLPTGMPENVVVRGQVPYQTLGAVLGEADIGLHFVKHSRHDFAGSPLKLFDYMACGLAIVTEGNGQRGAIIDQWQCGLKSTAAPADIAQAIASLERDRELCRRLGANGRTAALKYFNWKRVAEETEEILIQASLRHH